MKTLFYVSNRDGYLICRFTDNQGKRSAISTKLIPRNWNQQLQFSKGDSVVNQLIRTWQGIAESTSSLDSVKSKIKYNSKSIMLSELIDLYCSYRKGLSQGTIEKYGGFKNIAIDVSIDSIDKKYALKIYNKFLTHMGFNSAHKRMEQLSYFLNFAVDFDYLPKNPITGLKFKKVDMEIVYLEREEIDKIKNKNLIGRLDQIRDVFLFQCYTAMEYSRLLTYELKKNIDGKVWIYSVRKKTNKLASLPLFPDAQKILEKYDYELPIKSNQKMNAYLKEVQELCGIDKKLHTHLARHTFATTICAEEKVAPHVIAKMMGITLMRLMSSYKDTTNNDVSKETESFFNKSEDEEIKKAN